VVITLQAISPRFAINSLAMAGGALPPSAAVASDRHPASAKMRLAVLPFRIAAGMALGI